MSVSPRKADRPPLNPSDVYRPRLGTQKRPLWQTTMAETRAWRAMTSPDSRPAESTASKVSESDA